ncbi:hypothetical protein SDC9_115853 [bioreactor metagenome]|uniref:DUF3841 domain-containing protein n=1 Tax=bioreactor metagenome TaxID=1076179 RepID=A0A645BV13_9ZZZZ
MMLLWTIQHRAAYLQLLENGIMRADEHHLFCEDDFLHAYKWIAGQMSERIGQPPKDVYYPVWAWYQWEGIRKRPDMRSHRRWTKKGEPIVLLTIDVPDKDVLLSDFGMWHCVLSNVYLPLSEEDDVDHTEAEKVSSWNRIFQIDTQTHYWDTPKSTQATFWELRQEWVLKAERFISA